MKTNIIFTIVVLMAFSPSFSQNKKKSKNILDYSTELNLTSEQIEQIKKIQSENIEKNNELKLKQRKIKDEIKENNSNLREKVKEILTPEQLNKAKSIMVDTNKIKQNGKKAYRKQLIEYTEKNIKPAISEKRKEFDKNLSEEEKKIIAEFVAKHNALKDANKEIIDKKLIIERRKALHKETTEALKPIIANHKTELEKIFDDLKPQIEKWQNDIDRMMMENGIKNEEKKPFKMNKKNLLLRFLLNVVEE